DLARCKSAWTFTTEPSLITRLVGRSGGGVGLSPRRRGLSRRCGGTPRVGAPSNRLHTRGLIDAFSTLHRCRCVDAARAGRYGRLRGHHGVFGWTDHGRRHAPAPPAASSEGGSEATA